MLACSLEWDLYRGIYMLSLEVPEVVWHPCMERDMETKQRGTFQVTYANGNTGLRGTNSGLALITSATISLASGEYLTGISGKSSNFLNSVTFTSNSGSYGPFGGTGGAAFAFNNRILGFFGSVATDSSSRLTGLGVYY